MIISFIVSEFSEKYKNHHTSFVFSLWWDWFLPHLSYTPHMKKPKIAILHDAFLYRWGGERLVTLMAESLGADLITGFFSEGSFDPRELGFTGKMMPLGRPVFAKWIRHMILKWRFFWNAHILSEYDIVIFSGDCLGALRHVRSDAQKIYYCHTPPRYLYDFREKYLANMHFVIRPIFRRAFDIFSRIYEKNIESFDMIFTNSQNTHDRLLHYCHKESHILYPPTDTNRFISVARTSALNNLPSQYYLSCSRLSPPKRVNLVVRAFQELPEYNLVFTYGSNDPEKERILAMCAGYANIFPIPAPSDVDFISLLGWATANIYIPVDEDFGMTPVESMSCGVPVIGVREWWLLETVIEWETGKLIDIKDEDSWVIQLRKIIQDTSIDEWKEMKEFCRDRSGEFSLEKFSEQLKKLMY